MAERGKARTFNEDTLEDLLADVVSKTSQPAVMYTAFLLSFYAGLRVQEIAGLQWKVNIFNSANEFRSAPAPSYDEFGAAEKDSKGNLVMKDMQVLHIGKSIGKCGKPRNIPLHPVLKKSLVMLHAKNFSDSWVIPSGKNYAEQGLKHRAHALKMRMNRIYKALGFDDASSHSGRRSFITRASRRAEAFGNSLNDVRDLAGHSSILTTQHYIDPSPRQGDLVNALWQTK